MMYDKFQAVVTSRVGVLEAVRRTINYIIYEVFFHAGSAQKLKKRADMTSQVNSHPTNFSA